MFSRMFNSPVLNSWFSSLALLLNSVIVIPIVITKFNTNEINLWFLFFTVVAFSQAVLFGFNTTFMRFVSYSYAGITLKEMPKIRSGTVSRAQNSFEASELAGIIALMRKVYLCITGVYVLLMILMSYFVFRKPVSALENSTEGWLTWFFVAFSTSSVLYLSHYQFIMEGMNKVALTQRILGLVNIIGFGLLMIVSIFIPTLFFITMTAQTITLAVQLTVRGVAKRHFSCLGLEIRESRFNKEIFMMVWDSAWKTGVTTVLANMVKHISGMLIANMFAPAQSASFLFTKRLFDVLERFTMVTFKAKLPVIAGLRGRCEFEKLIPVLRRTHLLAYGVFIVGYAALIIFGDEILCLLGSNVDLGDRILIVMFSMSFFLSRWGAMTAQVSNQSNHVVEHKIAVVMFSVFFIVVYMFYGMLGVAVFPFAQIVGMIIVMPLLSRMVYKTINTQFFKYEIRVMLPMLVVMIILNVLFYMKIIN